MTKKESSAYLLITIMLLSLVMVPAPATADTVSFSVRPGPLVAMPDGDPPEIAVVGPAADRRLMLSGISIRDGRGNGKGWRVTAAVRDDLQRTADSQATSIGSAGPGKGLGIHMVAGSLSAGVFPTAVIVTIQSE